MIVSNQHTVTLSQTAVRLVSCEGCDADYVYQLSREGEGMSNSFYFLDESGAAKRAERKARKQLSRKMETARNGIPCPRCGHYQDHMIGKARYDKATPIAAIAVLAFVVAIVFFLLGSNTRMGLFGNFLGVVFLLVFAAGCAYGLYLINFYNPNKKPEEERLQYAEENAVLRKKFERGLADNAADEFERFRKRLAKKKERRFEMGFWADRGQLRYGDPIEVRLPVGEWVTVQLRRDSRDGAEFRFPVEVDGFEVEVVCVLNVYTKTRLRD
ncbi:MAG TPA: hypothetical protein VHR66_20180 [Gemmataceae bacterium]|jgi:uncharacterized membrane protein|nr:hypothetical protein [Gemmataceae bacterium]